MRKVLISNSGALKLMIRTFTSQAREPDVVAESAASLDITRQWRC
jgi:hypothetical protein